jgi:hypothetical protein
MAASRVKFLLNVLTGSLRRRFLFFFCLAAAATLPPEWVKSAWSLDAGPSALVDLLWTPASVFAQVLCWRAMLELDLSPPAPRPSPQGPSETAWASALGSGFLIIFRLSVLLEACTLPAWILLALIQPATSALVAACFLPSLLLLLPALRWGYHRMLGPLVCALEGQQAADSLHQSAARLRGTLLSNGGLLMIAGVLDLAFSLIPDAASGLAGLALQVPFLPLSFLLENSLLLTLYVLSHPPKQQE